MRSYLTQIALRTDEGARVHGIKPVVPAQPVIRRSDAMVNPFEAAPDPLDPVAPHFPTGGPTRTESSGPSDTGEVLERRHSGPPDPAIGLVKPPTMPTYAEASYIHDAGDKPRLDPRGEDFRPPDSRKATASSGREAPDSLMEPKAGEGHVASKSPEPQHQIFVTERIIHESTVDDTGPRRLKHAAPEAEEKAASIRHTSRQEIEMPDPPAIKLRRHPLVPMDTDKTAFREPKKRGETRRAVQPRVPEVRPALPAHSPPGFRSVTGREMKRLVIGSLKVEVVTSESTRAVPARPQPVRRMVREQPRSLNRLNRCKLQYGLGQV